MDHHHVGMRCYFLFSLQDPTLTAGCLHLMFPSHSQLGKSLYSDPSLRQACREENLLSDTVSVFLLRGHIPESCMQMLSPDIMFFPALEVICMPQVFHILNRPAHEGCWGVHVLISCSVLVLWLA